MISIQEESKGSTSEDDLEYESDVDSVKSGRSGNTLPKLKVMQYLST